MSKQMGDFSQEEIAYKSVGRKRKGEWEIWQRYDLKYFEKIKTNNIRWMRKNDWRKLRTYEKESVAIQTLESFQRKYKDFYEYELRKTEE